MLDTECFVMWNGLINEFKSRRTHLVTMISCS